ncbi:MAG: ion transporter [Azospirillaceae bacterium]
MAAPVPDTDPDSDPDSATGPGGMRVTGRRARVGTFVESRRIQSVIIAAIIVNAVTLGLETSEAAMAAAGPILIAIDRAVLALFVVEITLKLYAWRLGFFRSGWNLFDFVIVAIALVPATGPLTILRAFRILRVLRLMSMVPEMRRVIGALLRAIPGMTSIVAVLVMVFYVAAVLATKLFGDHPDPSMQEWFGTVWASMYTLFQIMTLESWSMGIVRPTMDVFPWSWLFFVPFIIVTSFAVLNLFIAIIVNAMQSQHEAEQAEQQAHIREAAHEEATALQHELAALRAEIARLADRLDGASSAESAAGTERV